MTQRNKIFNPTERDDEIIKAVNSYRFLRSGQIKRLKFSDNTDLQVTRRRLKRLYEFGLLDYHEPFQNGKGSIERIYFLTKDGAEYLSQKYPSETIILYKKTKNSHYPFLQHALDVSEFRINLELALKNNLFVNLERFISEYEFKSDSQKYEGMKRHKIYWEFFHPNRTKPYIVYPDGLIILRGKGEYENEKILLFLEVDRGTESLNIIREKIIGYNLLKKDKRHNQYGVESFVILFQCNSQKRVKNIQESIIDLEGRELVLLTDIISVNEKTILNEPIWTDYKFDKKVILKA